MRRNSAWQPPAARRLPQAGIDSLASSVIERSKVSRLASLDEVGYIKF
jgi:hypothetical protein